MQYTSMKEKASIWTAIAAFVLGWGMTCAGFIVEPLGEITDSVLYVLGQALIYTASVLGLVNYFGAEQRKLRKDVRTYASRLSKPEEPDEQETELEE